MFFSFSSMPVASSGISEQAMQLMSVWPFHFSMVLWWNDDDGGGGGDADADADADADDDDDGDEHHDDHDHDQ